MSERFILDAWALLALLQREEPAASRVKQLLQDAQDRTIEAFVSVINLGEVYYRIGKLRGEGEARTTVQDIRRLALSVIAATDDRAFAAASLKARFALSYADAFAGAAALELDATLLTGDPEMERLQHEIRVEKLSRHGR
jgi:uncharacterized protein